MYKMMTTIKYYTFSDNRQHVIPTFNNYINRSLHIITVKIHTPYLSCVDKYKSALVYMHVIL